MFEAMTAITGTMSTTHSHSAASTVDRLASRVAQGGVLTIEEAYRQIAHHLHLLIHIRLIDDGWRGGGRSRIVSEVRQLTGGIENGRPVTHLVYRADAGRTSFTPDPDFLADLAPFTAAWEVA